MKIEELKTEIESIFKKDNLPKITITEDEEKGTFEVAVETVLLSTANFQADPKFKGKDIQNDIKRQAVLELNQMIVRFVGKTYVHTVGYAVSDKYYKLQLAKTPKAKRNAES